MANNDDDFDVDTFLRLEATSFNQDKEVLRICNLQETTRNPLEILDHPPAVYITLRIEDRAVKLAYRKKSLLLHPDKCKHPRAQESFDILKKAETEVMDLDLRKGLLAFLRNARDAVLKRRNLKGPTLDEETEGDDMMKHAHLWSDPELVGLIKLEARKMSGDDQNRIKIRMKNEFDRRNTEAEEKMAERRAKVEHDKAWEATREERVGSWRKFNEKGGKKKKKKGEDDDLLAMMGGKAGAKKKPGIPKPGGPPRHMPY
ncbi:hypothetical protein HKX48_000961 [Thoreauomyces humboldtii]|nr:hypothetical protein HKX48_000961 [Thoreauomyces humboldtii]